jgi:hypothetical protein
VGILNWSLQTVGWMLVTLGGSYLAFQAGRRKECGLWERWYEQQRAIDAAERKQQEKTRSVTLTTVQFTRE